MPLSLPLLNLQLRARFSSQLSYKPRPDLNIFKANELGYTFVEIINPKKVILPLVVFTNIQIWMFLILKITILTIFLTFCPKNKISVFLGDFNLNLLNYNDHQPTNDFLDSLASNSFIPYILHPTRITSHSKTLIDNIFSNYISHEIISGNITATISDHLPNFHLFLTFCQTLLLKNLIFMKEIGQNLNRKTLYLAILIKIGLTYFKSINKMLICLWIFF